MKISLFLAFIALSACNKNSAPGGPRTPEEVLASGAPGTVVTVEGTVFTLSFDNAPTQDRKSFPLLPDRYVLVRTVVPRGVVVGDLELNQEDVAWGLGLHIDASQLAARTFHLPHPGDTVRATGTFRHAPWNGTTRPILDGLTELVITKGQPPRADLGEACKVDMDCRDEFICERATARCAMTPGPITWSSAWHDLNGACDSDADCPAGQSCDLGYKILGTGPFAAPYRKSDVGRHLCVPAAGATMASLCPRIDNDADLVSGRYAQGKEICVRGEVLLPAMANDGDTHVQLLVREPLPYPAAEVGYAIFGGATENTPPYKDPARPGGAMADPLAHRPVVVLGTYRYDDGHGWFEIHPIKAWWPAPTN